ncbi:MAG: dihydropteroate synthase [Phycisphaeraceae bacterium]|nr:MAG: dihydropteroate synthase [Phycisphaeraceae bacterium]
MSTPLRTPPDTPPPPAPRWRLAHDRALPLDRSRILAILNVTPDSFSDGGHLPTIDTAVEAARAAVRQGADMLDIGAESTRPGAQRIDAAEQIRRAAPVIEAIRDAGIDVPISIDTTLVPVAKAALEAGADAVNDVSGASEDPQMLTLVKEFDAGVILMHRRLPPDADSYSDAYEAPPDYGDESQGAGVVKRVRDVMERLTLAALQAGVGPESIVLDPGLGFGKTVEQNYRLISCARELLELGHPLLAGASRKSFIGHVSGVEAPRDRVAGSVAAAVAMRLAGVMLFRVHDVDAHAQALRVADRIAELTPANRTDEVEV